MRYPVSLANYPESFKGYVVSPTKICLQFNNPQVKLRLHDTDREDFAKYGPNSDRMLPIGTLGTDVDCIAVGCQMPVVEEYQLQLIEAYKKYWRLYRGHYEKTYGKSFLDFLLHLRVSIGNLLDEVERKWEEENGTK
jgi:hypothetical protein